MIVSDVKNAIAFVPVIINPATAGHVLSPNTKAHKNANANIPANIDAKIDIIMPGIPNKSE
ncbi:MAG TPA: hypothetical protein DCZ47_04515 [Candidatus Magasanikbacteria bacterium]|nr:hypothetical protein [Candidatus Magasanikbacteria bacterium]